MVETEHRALGFVPRTIAFPARGGDLLITLRAADRETQLTDIVQQSRRERRLHLLARLPCQRLGTQRGAEAVPPERAVIEASARGDLQMTNQPRRQHQRPQVIRSEQPDRVLDRANLA